MADITASEQSMNALNSNTSANIPIEDPPPKYTPPPSYTTATGARIAKFLRQSFRRSVRRIANVMGESSRQPTTSTTQQVAPPDYNTVLVEMNHPQTNRCSSVSVISSSFLPSAPVHQSTLERELADRVGNSSVLSVADVACILRSSFRRSRINRTANTLRRCNTIIADSSNPGSLSAENLVECAAPVGESSLVLDQDREVKPTTDNVSVI